MFLKGPTSILNSMCQHLAWRTATFCQAARLCTVHCVQHMGSQPRAVWTKNCSQTKRLLFQLPVVTALMSHGWWHSVPQALQHFAAEPRLRVTDEDDPSSDTPSCPLPGCDWPQPLCDCQPTQRCIWKLEGLTSPAPEPHQSQRCCPPH